MKVFTSIFVIESVRETFEEMEEALRADVIVPAMTEVGRAPRRLVMELHLDKEARRDRKVGNA